MISTLQRLFVDGRGDEMIVPAGENVSPGEVGEFLRSHADLVDAAVVGVDDEEMGQRLDGFVVVEPGSSISPHDIKEYTCSRPVRYKIPGASPSLTTFPATPR